MKNIGKIAMIAAIPVALVAAIIEFMGAEKYSDSAQQTGQFMGTFFRWAVIFVVIAVVIAFITKPKKTTEKNNGSKQ